MSQADSDVMAKVRLALGRTRPLGRPPTPPQIDEPITRLVHSDIGLPELFARRAEENSIGVETVDVENLTGRLVEFLRVKKCQRLAICAAKLLDNIGLTGALRDAGFDVRGQGSITLDETYDVDCGITDVYCAVAETGSLVVRASTSQGRSISLVPPIHVAIVEPRNFLPDLVDLFEKLKADGPASATTIITGPSKTADIEMNLVKGVHGPGVVQVFVLQ